MLTLAAAETFRGKAGTASAITYTISGDELTTADAFKTIAQGVLTGSTTILYTVAASTAALIKNIHLTNTTASNVSGVTFYLNGTAAGNQLISLAIPANGTAVYDGSWSVYDSNGVLQFTGTTGPSGTNAIGTTTTGNPGTSASVTNTGTPTSGIWNFTIPAGAVWRSGSTVPAGGLGVDGDFYLRTTTGDVYFKAAGAYSIVANITGPTGPPGAVNSVTATNGTIVVSGTGAAPTIARAAITGDVDIPAASNASTLATVNSNTGSFGGAASVPAFSVNGKGLITGVTATPISIAESAVIGLVTDLGLKAPLLNPALTGNPTAPTPSPGDNDTSIATTAFVTAADAAAIIDSIADSDTTHAPSRNAVFDALALKPDNTRTIATTAPLAGGGDLSANRTLSITAATTSAAGSMSASDKLQMENMWFDIVADGGADPTGSVDATTIINNAITTVGTAGGGTIYFPKGNFKTSAQITVNQNFITFRGAGRAISKIVPTHATGDIYNVTGIFTRWQDIRIEPTSFTMRTAGYGINITQTATNCQMERIDILGMWRAVRFQGQLARINDANLRECGYGAVDGAFIHIDPTSLGDFFINNVVTDNDNTPGVVKNGFAGVRVVQLSSLIMLNSHWIHCGGAGMSVEPTVGLTIPSIYALNCFFDQAREAGVGAGVNFSGAGNILRCKFIQCWFSENAFAGVRLNNSTIAGLDFTGCEFYGPGAGQPVGIEALAATDWSVRASRIAGNSTAGVRTTAGANHSFTVSDSFIGNTSGIGANGNGIIVQAGTYKRYQILDNRGLETNTTPGITDNGTIAGADMKNVNNNLGTIIAGSLPPLVSGGATLLANGGRGAVTSGVGETLLAAWRIPANAVQPGQVFRLSTVLQASGAGTFTPRVRVGTAGTTADALYTVVGTGIATAAANAKVLVESWFYVTALGAATTIAADITARLMPTGAATGPAAAAEAPGNVPTTAPFFFDFTGTMSAGTMTVRWMSLSAL